MSPTPSRNHRHRGAARRSRTRSWSAPRAAMPAPATGSPALDAATGKLLWRKYTIPAPGEPGSETWKGNNNAWQTGGGAVWVTGTYDPDTNQTLWGVGNPVPMMDARARPGDNLYHQQRRLLGSRQRQDELVLPVHAGRHVGLRRGRHPYPVRAHRRRPAAQARHSFGAQRLPLYDGAQQRRDGRCQALYGGQLDQGHRPEDRQAASTTIPARMCRPIRASPIRPPTIRSRRSAPTAPAATTTSRRRTARKPSSSTFRR